MVALLGWAAAVAVAAAIGAIFTGGAHFVPGACERLEPYLAANLVGQDLALRQVSDAVCDHLANPELQKPLVLSLHGPPGVGKSLFHLLAARALYSARPRPEMRCPGADCPGYKVLYGLDYTAGERAAQHAALTAALLDHVRSAPEALLVVEEYDKLDCHMRGFFRHLLEGGVVGNASLGRSVVVLESNTGYTALHGMLAGAGSREAIQPERAQRELKDLVFGRWVGQGCEERADTLKMVGAVDFFLPFFPLERSHVRQLFAMRLGERGAALAARRLGGLSWDAAVLDFLTQRIDYDGEYPIEGGKEVGTLVTRYVSRPVRQWAAAQASAFAAPLRVREHPTVVRAPCHAAAPLPMCAAPCDAVVQEGRLEAARRQRKANRKDAAPLGGGRLTVGPGSGELVVIEEPFSSTVDAVASQGADRKHRQAGKAKGGTVA